MIVSGLSNSRLPSISFLGGPTYRMQGASEERGERGCQKDDHVLGFSRPEKNLVVPTSHPQQEN